MARSAEPTRALVVHPHFHRRYTGITRHVENVVPELARELESPGHRLPHRAIAAEDPLG